MDVFPSPNPKRVGVRLYNNEEVEAFRMHSGPAPSVLWGIHKALKRTEAWPIEIEVKPFILDHTQETMETVIDIRRNNPSPIIQEESMLLQAMVDRIAKYRAFIHAVSGGNNQ